MSMNANTRFLGYATAVTFVVGVLAGILGDLSFSPLLVPPSISHRRLAEDISGPGPIIATQILSVLRTTLLVGYVLFLVGAAGYYAAGTDRYANDEDVHVIVFTALTLAIVLVVGMGFGLAVSGGMSSGFVEQQSASEPVFKMDANYTAVDEDRGALTIRHGGGDTVPSSDLVLKGDGFTNVSGVDQTEPGRWQGTTSPWKDGEHAVRVGDSVTVGVQEDCHISLVVYYYKNASSTYGEYDCAELQAESG